MPDQQRNKDFSPSLLHPFYFIRKGLQSAIRERAGQLHGRLMDFGCGSKPYLPLFQVDEYIGVDFENEGHPHDNEMIDVFYDGKSLPFPDNHFDSILCSEVFEHLFNLDTILVELNRVLKKGGKILITCPFVWNEHEVPHDYARYTQFALKDKLQNKGFSVLEINKTGSFVSAIFQIYILYFYTIYNRKPGRFILIRWLYKFFFVLMPNILGVIAEKILPLNKTLYLNNVVVAEKSK